MEQQAKEKLLHLLQGLESQLSLVGGMGKPALLKSHIESLKRGKAAFGRALSPARAAYYGAHFDSLYFVLSHLPAREDARREVLRFARELLASLKGRLLWEKDGRRDMVFLPYKAAMWDSLESIWRAAEDDPSCSAYVVPIPYANRKPDGTMSDWICERDLFPKDVPTLDWREFDLKAVKPDAVFIHNPYDNKNTVTDTPPAYYSFNLKPLTRLLVYVPYYTTSGGMSDLRRNLPSYAHMDYIVIQSEALRPYFDASLAPKLLPLGSPKFDRVIRHCQNPPEPPEDWREKMAGRKVYFYNTSLSAMIANPRDFLAKMRYVFSRFAGRKDACLLWRPHPLLADAIAAQKKEYLAEYEEIRRHFREKDLGIYDETPDVDDAIALSDAYIGNTGSSIVSCFGVAGKPVFLLNNRLQKAPGEDDWQWQVLAKAGGDWMILAGTKLYHAPKHDLRYTFYCDLSPYARGGYYPRIIRHKGRIYACPGNAQDVLVIRKGRVRRRIPLEKTGKPQDSFKGAARVGDYLFLLPKEYPSIVRLDTRTNTCDYLEGLQHVFHKRIDRKWLRGGVAVWRDTLFLASPTERKILAIKADPLGADVLSIPGNKGSGGYCRFIRDGEDFWLVPYSGIFLTRWNPATNEARDYTRFPKEFRCHRPDGEPCEERPFGAFLQSGDELLLFPGWGNMFLRLDKKTGEAREWETPFSAVVREKKGYFSDHSLGKFVRQRSTGTRYFCRIAEREIYTFDLRKGAFQKIEEFPFDFSGVKRQAFGFEQQSDWLPYGCMEDAFNSLDDFLEGDITGSPFDHEKAVAAYGRIAANADGTAGEKTYAFVRQRLAKLDERNV